MAGIDTEGLAKFLEGELETEADLVVKGEGDGYSNETAFVRWGERELVVRRPPPGEGGDGAHNVLREYRIMNALQQSEVPVPPTVCACDDSSVIGTEFYVMDRIEGTVIRRSEPDRFATPNARRRLAGELVETLVTIHQVDYEAVGLDGLGRPDGYLSRQIETFQETVARALEVTSEQRNVPDLIELGEWLEANIPGTSRDALVHGDYKLDNVMFAPGIPPEIMSIFDWELSTLGDPLADLGYTVLLWPNAEEHDAGQVISDRFTPRFVRREGYPTREQLVTWYEEATGDSFDRPRFYLALAAFKIAGLGELFYARYLEGDVEDEMYRAMGEAVPEQAHLAWEIIEGNWTV